MREERWIVERIVDVLILLIRPFEMWHQWRYERRRAAGKFKRPADPAATRRKAA